MYPDPNRVRCYRIAVNLDKYEYAVIESLSNLIGIDKSRLVREMVMRDAKSLLLDEQNNQRKDANEVTNQEL